MILVRDYRNGPPIDSMMEWFNALQLGHPDAAVLWDRDMADFDVTSGSKVYLCNLNYQLVAGSGFVEVTCCERDQEGFARLIDVSGVYTGWVMVRELGLDDPTKEYKRIQGLINERHGRHPSSTRAMIEVMKEAKPEKPAKPKPDKKPEWLADNG